MIYVCELSFDDAGHVPFNAGLLGTIRAAFPKEELTFFGAPTHIEELNKEVSRPLAGSMLWSEICPPTPGTSYVKRFFCEFRIIRRLLKMLPHDATARLVLTSAYPSTVLALKVAQWFGPRRTPVQIVLHGLSGVVGKRYRHPIRRFQDMKTALTLWGNNNIQYLVLEKPIRDTIEKSLPLLSGKIEALDHPISPNEAEFHSIELSEPIRFGFLGLADKTKGFPLFLKLANHIAAKYGRRAEFHVIGRFPQNGAPMNGTDVLATKPGTALMSRADFIRGVSPLHFIVLPHEAVSYALTASGILLDAIAWQKPIIARKIPIFEAMFERHGEIGFLFSDETELKDIVEQILSAADKSRYQRQILGLRDVRKSRDPKTLATAYRVMCERNELLCGTNRSFRRSWVI
jgi:hypothetical protein